MSWIYYVIFIIGSFLSGSILFSNVIAQLVLHRDISKDSYDGNPGATNTWLICGPKWGYLCFLLDFLKGFIPVFIATFVFDKNNIFLGIVAVMPVLGHVIGVFNSYHGGKAISVSFGSLCGLIFETPLVAFLAAGYILFTVILKIKPNGISSILSFTLMGLASVILSAIQKLAFIGVAGLLIASIVIIKHVMVLKLELEDFKNKNENIEYSESFKE